MNTLIKTVLIDLSGTLHIENNAIPGAISSLKRLREAALNVKFVTNTTKESRSVLYSRLVSLGFDVEADEIFTSLHAARDLLIKNNLKAQLLLEPAAMEDFENVSKTINDDEHPDAVVVGLAPSKFQYDVLNKAFRNLLNGSQLIAIHEARYYKTEDGLCLGPGPFVKALEYSSGCRATVVGKPTANFFRAALGSESAETAVMIGDVCIEFKDPFKLATLERIALTVNAMFFGMSANIP